MKSKKTVEMQPVVGQKSAIHLPESQVLVNGGHSTVIYQ